MSATGLLLAALLAGLPPRVDARYRVELGGEHVGWAHLVVSCAEPGCQASWESVLRAPQEAGGGTLTWRIAIEAEPGGEARRVRAVTVADGRERRRAQGGGPVPASLAELLLASAAEGERRCLRVRDEESGREGEACARREGPWLAGAILGDPIRFRAASGEAPAEVLLPGQRMRFVADPVADLPARPPRLYGAAVDRSPRSREPLCGVAPDPAPSPAPPSVPREFPPGASCRERTARYLALAGRAGLRGRHALGVAFDGRALVWHEWAELQVGGRWIPVDPSFEQAPAQGPRFTVTRYEEGDAVGRAAAGRAVLGCWVSGGG